MLTVDGAINCVGSSQLGIGTPLDARIDLGRLSLPLDVDTLFDARGNRFAFGNPFHREEAPG